MLADAHAARVIDGVGESARHGSNTGFAETLYAVEPAGFQAVDVELGLLRNVHDGGEPVGEVADAVVAGAGEFAVPWNRVGGGLSALYQRSHHVGFRYQRIDDQARVLRIQGA